LGALEQGDSAKFWSGRGQFRPSNRDKFHKVANKFDDMKAYSKVSKEFPPGNALSARFLLKRELLSDYG
jgi:hypothetical protein